MSEALHEIERAVCSALGTYSNVHRGSGHHSLATTRLYERSREIVLEHLGLSGEQYVVIFCSPRRARSLEACLAAGTHRSVSSRDIGLPLGLRAVAVLRKALPGGAPLETGGGTARLIAPDWAIWAKDPDRFEAGTPAVISAIALARGLQLLRNPVAVRERSELAAAPELDGFSGAELLERLREMLVGRGAMVPTASGERAFVNLDNAASTPTFEPIWNAVRGAWRAPVEEHPAIVEHARSVCASVLGAPRSSYDLIFTSNTTEAINIVAASLGNPGGDPAPVVLNTLLEHNSNELPWRHTRGLKLIRLPFDGEGFVDPGDLESRLRDYNEVRAHGEQRIALVAVTGASNVLGTYNDLAELGRIAHRYGARLLVDGAQCVAHRRIDMEAAGIDYLAFSGHKVYAPFGGGVLLARKGMLSLGAAELDELQASGEENVGGIAGLAKALELLSRIGFDRIQAHEQELTRRALSGLAALPRVRVLGVKTVDSPRFERKGGVIAFDMKGRLPGGLARMLVERGGIGVRYGCHCAHLTIKRLVRVPRWAEQLQYAMVKLIPGFSPPGVVRVSFGLQTSMADVDALLEQLGSSEGHRRTRELRARMDAFVRDACNRVFDPPPP